MTNDRMEHLHFLVPQAVSAVIFSAAYLQIELDDATLTCIKPPLVLGPDADINPHHSDYKNQLCLFIDKRITNITETGKGLVLTFDNGELLFEKEDQQELLVITDGNGEWHSYPDVELEGP